MKLTKQKIRNLFFKKHFNFDIVPGEIEVLRPWVAFAISFSIVALHIAMME